MVTCRVLLLVGLLGQASGSGNLLRNATKSARKMGWQEEILNFRMLKQESTLHPMQNADHPAAIMGEFVLHSVVRFGDPSRENAFLVKHQLSDEQYQERLQEVARRKRLRYIFTKT